MLTFLRKIRKSLIESGSTRKYLLYAIGEIALVVIGILIALQINNWNALRKDIKLEQSYLLRLRTDIMTDTAYLHDRISHSKAVLKQNYSFIHEAYKNVNPKRNLKDYISIPMFSSADLTMQNTTYLELLNTGKIDLIRNENLKIEVIQLYRNHEAVDKQMQEINEFTTDLWEEWNKTVLNIKYREFMSDLFDETHMFYTKEREWFNDPQSEEFRLTENTIGWYYAKHKIFINHFNELLNNAVEVLENIDDELGVKK